MADLYRFSTPLRVRFNETDAQGHVNFAWYLNYFDVALIEYLRALGYSYNDMLEEGFDMLYIDAHTAYKSAAYFDEILQVRCRVGKIGNTSLRFDFQVFDDAVSGRSLLARSSWLSPSGILIRRPRCRTAYGSQSKLTRDLRTNLEAKRR